MNKLTDFLDKASLQKRQLLLRKLREKSAATTKASGRIVPRDPTLPAPLSFAQQRLWFLAQLDPTSRAYHLAVSFAVTGPLDVAILAASLGEVVRRHATLRTTFVLDKSRDEPIQVIAPELTIPLPVVDLGALAAADGQSEAARLVHELALAPYELSRGPLFRPLLVRLDAASHRFALAMHHLVTDGWSFGVLLRELVALYGAFAAGRPSPLPELEIQYADFAAWQRSPVQEKEHERQLAFWHEQLAGFPPALTLPFDHPPAGRARTGLVSRRLGGELQAALQKLAQRENASLFMVLTASLAALLSRLADQDDVVLGTPIANRNRAETEGLIGFFVNLLMLRLDLAGDPTLAEILARARQVSTAAFAHQDVPFERLVGELPGERGTGQDLPFQAMLALNKTAATSLQVAGLELEAMSREHQPALCELDIEVVEGEAELELTVKYRADRFDQATIARFLARFEQALGVLVESPATPLSHLPLASAAERHQILYEWPAGAPASGVELADDATTLGELLASRAGRAPDRLAVSRGEESLTYGELSRRGGELARHLRRLGVGPDVAVGLCCERSLAMMTALWGILEAGGAYLPLDPSLPAERLAFMLADAEAPVVLTQASLRAALPAEQSVVCLDEDWPEIARAQDEVASAGPWPESLAYILYTSGSTGAPKGTQIVHRTVIALAVGLGPAILLGPHRAAMNAPLHFDASVQQWLYLLFGGHVVLIDEEARRDVERLVACLAEERVEGLDVTPSHLAHLVSAGLLEQAPLRRLLVGGEAFTEPLWSELAGCREVLTWNVYGPTECTVDVTAARLEPGISPSLGRPLRHVELRIVDRRQAPRPIGAAGELLIGGGSLARGYLARPGLTAERFLPDPWRGVGARLYRSGDLCRRRFDGAVEYLGRIDQQVKLRGYRIELGEIEAVLHGHPAVEAAAVAVQGERLLAFVVAEEMPSGELAAHLRRRLPDYMVPSLFVPLDALPLLPSRKVDRRALAAMALDAGSTAGGLAPRTPSEEILAGIFAALLDREGVGVDESFFELGGHSLLATQAMARIRDAFGVELPLRTLFEAPRIAELAERVEAARRAEQKPLASLTVRHDGSAPELSYAQKRLWFLDRFEGPSAAYNMPAVLRLSGDLDVALLARCLEQLATRHEGLRTAIAERGGTPVPRRTRSTPALPVVDLQALNGASRQDELDRRIDAAVTTPFDLARGPLLRLRLLRLAEDEHVLVFNLHHIVGDGWSLALLVREMTVLYRAFLAGEPSPLAPLKLQYTDYAAWQREQLDGGRFADQLRYWVDELAGLPPRLELPTDRPRATVRGYRGGVCRQRISPSLMSRHEALGRELGATPFMTLLAVLQVLFSRLSRQSDFAIGVPVAGRARVELEGLVGIFLNNLVLRCRPGGEEGVPSFRELVAQTRKTALLAYENQDVPIEKLLEELEVERDTALSGQFQNPLFQVMLNMLNLPEAELELPGLSITPVEMAELPSKLDLTIYAHLSEDGLELRWAYNAELFSAARIEEMTRQFELLLEQMTADASRPIDTCSLLTDAARAVLPDPQAPLDDRFEGAIPDLFAARAKETPERVAVVDRDGAWTYGELARRVDDLAARLVTLGVEREDAVLIYAHREASLVQAVLATLRAGGAFVLLDPLYPAERLVGMARQVHPRVSLELTAAGEIPAELAGALDELGCKRLAVEPFLTVDAPSASAPASWPELGPDHRAVIAFTSGSTGTPRGIEGRHGPLTHFLPWQCRHFALVADDRYTMLSGLAHDPLQRDLFTPLTTGGVVVIPDPDQRLEPGYLARWMTEERAGIAHLTPSMVQLLSDTAEPGSELIAMRRAFVVGEMFTVRDANRLQELAPKIQIVNFFGSTETQRAVGFFEYTGPESLAGRDVLPLGRGMPDVQLLVTRPDGELAGLGEIGEIRVRSPHLARGYLDDPELTAARFVDGMYLTGDLGRYRLDGVVEPMGRIDHQVKIRGFRVELGEIEVALRQHSAVRECVVVADQSETSGTRLVAYVVGGVALSSPPRPLSMAGEGEQEFLPPPSPAMEWGVGGVRTSPAGSSSHGLRRSLVSSLREHLRQKLPDYMVPPFFVALEALPRLPNSKIDRRRLPSPSLDDLESEQAFVAPRNPTEEAVAGIWRQLLDVERLGIDDSFFELGGHSLLATQAVSRIHEALGVELPLRTFFAEPTVRAQAVAVLELAAEANPEERWKSVREQVIERRDSGTRQSSPTAPLSFAQERLWFLHQLAPESAFYNMPRTLHFRGELDPDVLLRSFNEIVRRHEILRTTFAVRDGEPAQIIAPELRLAMPVVDLTRVASPERLARGFGETFLRQSFDLGKLPLLALLLLRLGPDEHVLFLVIHHIISDGWSQRVLHDEIARIYSAFAAGEPSPLPELEIQYSDFAVWQRGWLSAEVLESQLAYWKELTAGAPELLELPTDRPRPAVQSLAGSHLPIALSETLTQNARAFSDRHGMSLYMPLFATYLVLLKRYSGRDDLVVGSPIANRNKRELENLIGFFVNMLLRRADLSGRPTFSTLLEQVKDATLEGYDHQDLPFERLVEELRPERNLAYTPLFQVMFNLLSFPHKAPDLSQLAIDSWDLDTATSKYDLSLYFAGTGSEPLVGFLEYSSDLFDRVTVVRLRSQYICLLRAALADPEARLDDLPLLGAAARHAVLVEKNAVPSAMVGVGEGIHHLVETRARLAPESVALVAGDEALSHTTLAQRAQQIAELLRGHGVGPDVLVGISVSRGLDMVAALLGVLRSGGAYVPLDPSYPAARLAMMVEDACPRVLLTESGLGEGLVSLRGPSSPPQPPSPWLERGEPRQEVGGPGGLGVVHLDALPFASSKVPGDSPILPHQLAYVIYTSGSTGKPKGVAVGHRSVVAFLRAMGKRPGLTADEVFVAVTTLSFDIAGLELYLPLLSGARLVVASDDETGDGNLLATRLAESCAEVMQGTPATWNLLLATGSLRPGALPRAWSGGEALTRALADRLMHVGAEVWNLYGPTETTIWSAVEKVERGVDEASSVIALGVPIAGTSVYLLDGGGEPTPLGVPGELMIGGAGLARGYLARPSLTAERFVPDPFAEDVGARFYRTGDLVRYRASGSLEFLGRIDHQVKVRGFRIELGEIEAALVRHPGVRSVVVGVRRRPPSGDQLVAWLEPEDGEPSVEELRNFVEERLPDYMVPSAFVMMEVFPRTPAGKVDRRALPDPEGGRQGLSTDFQAPETPLERFLAAEWRRVLAVDELGVDDRFFHLGGNSIQAAIFTNALQEKLGEIVHVMALFRHQTIKELAAFLEQDYAEALARLGVEGLAPTSVRAPEQGIDAEEIVALRQLAAASRRRGRRADSAAKQPDGPVFVLSPPRAGSTLLRVMMAGHPRLFAPPELELLGFDTLGERARAFSGVHSFGAEGLLRTVMELRGCDAATAKQVMEGFEAEDMDVGAFYAELQAWSGERRLVDKTTTYALDPGALHRAEELFEDARYIHLLRHPCATIKSYVDVRLDQFLRFENPFTGRQQAELLWLVDHQNILAFLEDVPAERQIQLRFEDLLSDPETRSRELCAWLGLDFEPAMLEPYRGRRMTDGVHAASRMHGDPRFHEHDGIDAGVAEKWRGSYRWRDLAPQTRQLAVALGYPNEDEAAPAGSLTALPPAADEPPLSFAQQRLWFLDRLEPGRATYNIPAAVRFEGRLDVAALEAALGEVVRRHAVLRTTFAARRGVAVQVVRPSTAFALPLIDLSGLASRDALDSLADEEARRPFDLETGPLFRAQLLRLAEDDQLLLVTLHHIVSDGWSIGVMVREVALLYSAFVADPVLPSPSPLAELPVQYADFARWQRDWLAGPQLAEQLAWWREQLAGVPALELPTDRPRPPVMSQRGAHLRFAVPAELTAELSVFSRQSGTTLFMTLLAAFELLLARLSGRQDFAVGTPIAGRNQGALEPMIGFFVNTLAVRSDRPGGRFDAFLERVQSRVLEVFAHQEIPFEQLVGALDQEIERDLSRPPIVQVLFALQNTPRSEHQLPGLRLTAHPRRTGTAKFDLELMLTEVKGHLDGRLEYASDLFDATTMLRLTRSFEALLAALVRTPEELVEAVELLSSSERHQLLWEWNDSAALPPAEAPVHEQIAEQARRRGDAVALVTDDAMLSYGALEAGAERLAGVLAGLGDGAQRGRFGIFAEPSPATVVGLLGVLKAGGAYIPLDPSYPRERLAFMAEDAGLAALLTLARLAEEVPKDDLPVLFLDLPLPDAGERRDVVVDVMPTDLAYMIYTSGSTGKPKGVGIEHRALTSFLAAFEDAVGLDASDALLAVTPLSFDISGLELFWPLLRGARLELSTRAVAQDGRALAAHRRARRVSVMQATPATWQILDASRIAGEPSPFAGLRVLCGGEALPRALGRTLAAEASAVWNLYGPTEATIWATTWKLERDLERVLLGRPLANTVLRLFAADLRPAPIGAAGELFLGGGALARGYLGRPGLSAERFVPDPLAVTPGARLYRTGDLTRLLADGQLEFLGRVDHQVKVRGFRIELGEIEAVLGEHPWVQECVVVAQTQAAGARLVAYVAGVVIAATLREHLQDHLPEHMVPSLFIELEKLPRLPNGKVDRKSLPSPDPSTLESERPFVTPRNATEQTLAEIWQQVLGVERVGIDDSFFELGGHSLLATQVVSRLHEAFGVELPLRQFFLEPTVRGQAVAVLELAAEANPELRWKSAREQAIERRPPSSRAPLSFAQHRLWFLHKLAPESPFYTMPRAFKLRGELELAILKRTFDEIVRRHEILRTSFAVDAGEPVQIIAPRLLIDIPLIDLSATSSAARTARALGLRFLRQPFDLEKLPLLDLLLVRLDGEEHVLFMRIHHIVFDGWSEMLLLNEVTQIYAAFAAGEPSPLPELPIQYSDFAVWQRGWLSEAVLAGQLAHWKELADGAPELLELPTDRPRPAVQSLAGEHLYFKLSDALATTARAFSDQRGLSLYMTSFAVFQVLLKRYSGRDDLVVGSPIANRNKAELEDLIGFFVNMLLRRSDLSGNPTFSELLEQVRHATLEAYDHQDLPFERLVAELRPERNLAYTPLFQVMFNLLNFPPPASSRSQLKIGAWGVDTATSKYDLSLYLFGGGEGSMPAFLEYSRDLFDRSTIVRLRDGYLSLLRAALEAPEQRLGDLPLLSAVERHAILVERNASGDAMACAGEGIHHLVAARARLAPESIALVAGDAALSHAGLARRAAQIARLLGDRGVGPDVLVGVSLSRSVDMAAALLGVLASGGAYVPLDPSYPAARLAMMLEDACPRVLLTETGLADVLTSPREPSSPPQPPSPCVVHLDALPSRSVEALPEAPVLPGQLAYVIYTSGSTGRPKGVAVGHRSVVAFLRAMERRPGLTAGEVFVAVTTLSFDIAGLELYLPLMAGARLIVASDEETGDGNLLATRLAESRASVMQATPATWNLLLATDSLRAGALPRVWSGGEALTRALADRLLAMGAEVWNLYGPTETTIWSAVEGVTIDDGTTASVIALGTPIAGTRFYLLDAGGSPTPLGVPGELMIGGAGLARGYLARPSLTAECFLPDPYAAAFAEEPGARLYRTGDLVRYRASGSLEFLGRVDHQVKVRGFRIELGEIEAVLARHPAVRSAVVGVRRRPPSGDQLVAWLEPADGEPSVESLRAFVEERLPDYMVPAAFVVLDAFPRTPAGKVDRRALPDPEGGRQGLSTDFQAPETPLERFLAEEWKRVLAVDEIGVEDRFFHLGGNSIQAAIFTNHLQEKLGEIVHVTALFRHQTIRELVAFLETDYAAALRRLGLADATAQADGSEPEKGIDEEQIALLRRLAAASQERERASRRAVKAAKRLSPGPIFVLSPPRAGSTLLRVMMAGHPGLFAPPELELLSFATMGERARVFTGVHSFGAEGLLRAVMELRGCDAGTAKALMEGFEAEDMDVGAFYAQLQAWCGERRLVDKTTTYALDPDALHRAEELFEDARYIHLLRHPCATIKSYVDVRLDQFLRFENPFSGRQQAELLWLVDHQNILDFLQDVPEERQLRLRFEDLLSEPEAKSRELCAWLDLDFEPAMLEPYSGRRMTDGIHEASTMHGDPRFHEHSEIDAEVAEKWRGSYRFSDLAPATRELAVALGYPREDDAVTSGLTIPRRANRERAPLSWMQEAFWMIEQLEQAEVSVYRSNHQVLLAGTLDVAAIQQSFAAMVERHEILRTRFGVDEEGQTYQEVLPELPVLLPEVDLTALAAEHREAAERRVILERSRRSFDLTQAPVWRLLLVRTGVERFTLLVSMHHILNDHWSMNGIFFPELATCYEAFAVGQEPRLPELSVQYADYAQWERDRLQDDVLERLLGYWGKKLGGGIPQLQLKTDRPRPARSGFRGETLSFTLSNELTSALEKRGREANVSLYMVTLAAYQLLLARYSGQQNILVASPTANRFRAQTERLCGCFTNMLLLNTDFAGNPTLQEALGRVGDTVMGAFSHQELPFMLTLANFPPPDFAFDRSPFQAMFTFLNTPHQEVGDEAGAVAGIAASLRSVGRGTTDQDLALWLRHDDQIHGTLIYDNEIFERSTIERMMADYERLLEEISRRPEARLAEVIGPPGILPIHLDTSDYPS